MPIFGGLGLILLALWIFCIVDVITSNESEVRNLPKMGWVLIVVFLPTIGSIIWLVAGRPQNAGRATWSPPPGTATSRPLRPAGGRDGGPPPTTRFPEYERPGRHIAANLEDDEEFLRRCRERAEEQRRAAQEQRRADEES